MVAGLVAALLAPVTGGLFGLAYGTAIRIGYEQIYPLLFPVNAKGVSHGASSADIGRVLTGLIGMYDIIGGKGAHEFGIGQGIKNAMKGVGNELTSSPELNLMIKLEAGANGIDFDESKMKDVASGIGSLDDLFKTFLHKVDVTDVRAGRGGGVDDDVTDLDEFPSDDFKVKEQDKSYNDKVINLKIQIKSMTHTQLQKLATDLPFMGFKAADFKMLGDLILNKINEITTTDKTLPPADDDIPPGGRVSKQTLRLQRTLLITNVKRWQAKLVPANARLKTATSRGDRSMISAATREVQNVTIGLNAAKQELANFLARWKHVSY